MLIWSVSLAKCPQYAQMYDIKEEGQWLWKYLDFFDLFKEKRFK